MKNYSFLISALLIVLAAGLIACNKKEDPLSQNKTDIRIDTELRYENDLFYPIKDDKPFTGEVKWRYENGELAARIGYKEGHLVSRESFYRDGQMMEKLEKSGDGDTLITSITWYPSGQMGTKYDRGFVKQWYRSGQIRAVWNTDSAGILEGKATAWYPDGTLLGIEHYKDGKLEGERILYDSTGNVKAAGFYRKGEKQEIN